MSWIVIWRTRVGELKILECRSEKDAQQVVAAIGHMEMRAMYQKIDF